MFVAGTEFCDGVLTGVVDVGAATGAGLIVGATVEEG